LGAIRIVIFAFAVLGSSSRRSIWPTEMPAVITRDFSNSPVASWNSAQTEMPSLAVFRSLVERISL
jgi:hypothetical protein